MKRLALIISFSAASLLLSGCAIVALGGVLAGGMWTYSAITGKCMNGPCAGSDADINIRYPNTYEHWVKYGVTAEQRRWDALSCGGAVDKYVSDRLIFSREQLEAERRPEDLKYDFPVRDRLTNRWAACMNAKGYEPQAGPFYKE